MDDAGNVTQDGEEDVDEEVAVAAALKKHAEWGKEDGEDDLDDVAAEENVSVRASGAAQAALRGTGGEGTNLPVKGMMKDVVNEVRWC